MKEEKLKITQVAINASNPRTITGDKFDKLITSILVLPKMLEVRPVVADSKFVALGGNMRIKALQSIAEMSADDIASRLAADKTYSAKSKAEQDALLAYWAEWLAEPYVNTIVVDNFSEAEQKEFIIKDNVSFGKWDWDILANEWDSSELEDWGLNLPIQESEINIDEFFSGVGNEDDKAKGDKLTVSIPEELAEKKDEIKSLIEAALSSEDFSGIKVK